MRIHFGILESQCVIIPPHCCSKNRKKYKMIFYLSKKSLIGVSMHPLFDLEKDLEVHWTRKVLFENRHFEKYSDQVLM